MDGPLTGVRVLEVANFVAAPGCAALLADMGAEVIKVESPTGDPIRHLSWPDFGPDLAGHAFQVDNHGKRSVTASLDRPEGAEVVRRLAERVDILITNLTPPRAARYGLTYAVLAERNPRLIYAGLTGLGTEGAERERLGFDVTTFWARSGFLSVLANTTGEPPFPSPGTGDHVTATMMTSGILAALYERERSGRGQELRFSLLHAGMWVLGYELTMALAARKDPPAWDRATRPNPLANPYRCADGRWLILLINPPDRYWPAFCAAIGRPDLLDDPRSNSFAARQEYSREVVGILDAVFASAPRDDWGRRLDAHGLIWGPVQSRLDVLDDEQARANGAFAAIAHPNLGPVEIVAPPLQFGSGEVRVRGPAPELGQHTEEVLLELGYAWEEIAALRDAGAL